MMVILKSVNNIIMRHLTISADKTTECLSVVYKEAWEILHPLSTL